MSIQYDTRVGSVRPSQLMWAYGIGAIADLPRLSVVVEGLERWETTYARIISEERLLAAVRRELGPQVERLHEPPIPDEDPFGKPDGDPIHRIGVPVGVFPRWLRCPRCVALSDAESGVFNFKGSSRFPDDCRFVHENCTKRKKGPAPACIPSRFLVACKAGHLDDFPWREFVHRGPTSCTGTLRFYEKGSSLETANLFVACDEGLGFSSDNDDTHSGAQGGGCGMRPRSMVDAFGEAARLSLPRCRGRHPHLRAASGDCGRELKTILLGSSSAWFPKTISALSIPTGASELAQAVEDEWAKLGEVQSIGEVALFRRVNQLGAATQFSDEEIWDAICARRGDGEEDGDEGSDDLKGPEWAAFDDPDSAPKGSDFEVTLGEVPDGFDSIFRPTVLVQKIREVNALVGFTRLESPEDLERGEDDITYAPLSRNDPTWVPANEVRGEGILLRFRPEALAAWENRDAVNEHLHSLELANAAWRQARKLPDPTAGYKGHRHVLIHSFSHLLMRELALECGYSSSSIRERVYASMPGDPTDMAGVLIYTAAPDSEGTLGGLVRLGEPKMLGRLIAQAIEHAGLCASDPLCAEHDPVPDRSLHLAACHACSFAPETGCEFGNRFLDRAVVVPTLQTESASLFG